MGRDSSDWDECEHGRIRSCKKCDEDALQRERAEWRKEVDDLESKNRGLSECLKDVLSLFIKSDRPEKLASEILKRARQLLENA